MHSRLRMRPHRRRVDELRWLQGVRRSLLTSEVLPPMLDGNTGAPPQARQRVQGEQGSQSGDRWKVPLIVVAAGAGTRAVTVTRMRDCMRVGVGLSP